MKLCRYNDTSVIRSPVIMKTGRLKSYEVVSQAAAWRNPYFRGEEKKYGETIV